MKKENIQINSKLIVKYHNSHLYTDFAIPKKRWTVWLKTEKDDFTKRENYEVKRNRVNKCYKLKWLWGKKQRKNKLTEIGKVDRCHKGCCLLKELSHHWTKQEFHWFSMNATHVTENGAFYSQLCKR